MSHPDEPNAPQRREQVQGRLRHVTRAAVLAAVGATAGIGIVVAHDHPGASGSAATTDGSSGSGTATTDNTGEGSTTNTGAGATSSNTGSTGNTGGFSTAPSASTTRPTVTSGGTSR